nr:hypothetical protein GCM10020092_024440 [Actinoplanes digitatis]
MFFLAKNALEAIHEGLQVSGVEMQIIGGAAGGFRLFQRVREFLAGHVADGLSEHLNEPPVRVPGEALVAAGLCREARDALVVEPDVEHGLHHAGHREGGTRTHRDQQRVARVTQPTAHRGLQRGEMGVDLLGQPGGVVAGGQVGLAGAGRDGESG